MILYFSLLILGDYHRGMLSACYDSILGPQATVQRGSNGGSEP
ncbi:hypothetical protein SETIT_J024200v2 [Setaria italica]|uniref:Uncharacterized protein n=2 Tax=Setaria TaxID=4554 RepID=K4APK3_SETIT|nr:hypothetical protein SETIT_J024200v2 [Setaria italica]TKW08999.1 hypothetical protein SEVIR_6G062700v2 [Setaria viridis]TKW09007.1 hypothetical protein SEVIR_6G063300v2 [Setaria viridis]